MILSRLAGHLTADFDTGSLPMLTYLLQAQSNRTGGLDPGQPHGILPRQATADLADMLRAADLLQAGQALPADLEAALLGGTSIGDARPKATLVDGGHPGLSGTRGPR